MPTVITVRKGNGSYETVKYWEPSDGAYFESSIREKFPRSLWGEAKANEYFDLSSSVEKDGEDGPSDAVDGKSINSEILTALKEKFPYYFVLDTTYGLDVFVWQLAANSFRCGVLAQTIEAHEATSIWNLKGATVGEMKVILSTYDLPRDNIRLISYQPPYSSYFSIADDAYIARLEAMFGLTVTVVSHYNLSYDRAVFDVDGDGKDEYCVLGLGVNLEKFSFSFYAREAGSVSFGEGREGNIRVQTDGGALFDISAENGKLVLAADGVAIEPFHFTLEQMVSSQSPIAETTGK